MINLIFVDNEGRNVLLGYAIVEDEKEETYIWMLESLLSKLKKHPEVIISDECPSIAKGK
jgi:hypothetical protein